jgi:hypothetical protein
LPCKTPQSTDLRSLMWSNARPSASKNRMTTAGSRFSSFDASSYAESQSNHQSHKQARTRKARAQAHKQSKQAGMRAGMGAARKIGPNSKHVRKTPSSERTEGARAWDRISADRRIISGMSVVCTLKITGQQRKEKMETQPFKRTQHCGRGTVPSIQNAVQILWSQLRAAVPTCTHKKKVATCKPCNPPPPTVANIRCPADTFPHMSVPSEEHRCAGGCARTLVSTGART